MPIKWSPGCLCCAGCKTTTLRSEATAWGSEWVPEPADGGDINIVASGTTTIESSTGTVSEYVVDWEVVDHNDSIGASFTSAGEITTTIDQEDLGFGLLTRVVMSYRNCANYVVYSPPATFWIRHYRNTGTEVTPPDSMLGPNFVDKGVELWDGDPKLPASNLLFPGSFCDRSYEPDYPFAIADADCTVSITAGSTDLYIGAVRVLLGEQPPCPDFVCGSLPCVGSALPERKNYLVTGCRYIMSGFSDIVGDADYSGAIGFPPPHSGCAITFDVTFPYSAFNLGTRVGEIRNQFGVPLADQASALQAITDAAAGTGCLDDLVQWRWAEPPITVTSTSAANWRTSQNFTNSCPGFSAGDLLMGQWWLAAYKMYMIEGYGLDEDNISEAPTFPSSGTYRLEGLDHARLAAVWPVLNFGFLNVPNGVIVGATAENGTEASVTYTAPTDYGHSSIPVLTCYPPQDLSMSVSFTAPSPLSFSGTWPGAPYAEPYSYTSAVSGSFTASLAVEWDYIRLR